MSPICVIGETDPFVASLLRRFAEASGLRVIRVQVGQDLLNMARQVSPAVIILDAELPGQLRGWEAARALKVDTATCDIPIINCSWLPRADAVALIGEVAGHLQKPELHYEDFVAALNATGAAIKSPAIDVEPTSQSIKAD